MTVAEFLRERLTEQLENFKTMTTDSLALISYANMIGNLRYAIDWHENFPTLIETKPEFNLKPGGVEDVSELTYSMSQEIQWLTQQEYVKKFGSEPPTAPLLLAWVQQYAWHPDFNEAWLTS